MSYEKRQFRGGGSVASQAHLGSNQSMPMSFVRVPRSLDGYVVKTATRSNPAAGRPQYRPSPVGLGTITEFPTTAAANLAVSNKPMVIKRQRLVSRRPVNAMRVLGTLGDDPATSSVATSADAAAWQASMDRRTTTILDTLNQQNKDRKLALYIGAAGALFAAIKMGIVAFPHVRARVSGE